MISVALATYNGEKFITEQINSILSQTYTDFEIVICDDCSTDNTVNIISELALKDKRIIIYKNEKNLGFRKNFEKLVGLCSGEYIAFSDQDDIWTEDHLEVLINNIGDRYISCANCEFVNQDGVSLKYTMKDALYIDYVPTEVDKQFKYLVFAYFVQGSAMLIKTEFAKSLLPIPEFFRFHDAYYALLSTAKEVPIVYSEKIILKYRQHDNNVTNSQYYSFVNKVLINLKKQKFYKKLESVKKRELVCNYLYSVTENIDFKDYLKKSELYYSDFQNKKIFRPLHYLLRYNDYVFLNKRKSKRLFKCFCCFIGAIYYKLFL